MNRILKLWVAGIFFGLSLNALAEEPKVVMWVDLAPKIVVNEIPGITPEDDAAKDAQPVWDFTRPVEELDGTFAKVPGFIVPLESDEGGLLTEFLLVPYYGACIHSPPPPPNQVVYVKLEEAFELTSMYQPYWITGTLRTQDYSGYLAESLYTMEGTDVEIYENTN